MNPTGVEITAGLGGFLVLFGLGLALWFLGRDLSRRLRRSRQREELRAADAEAAAADAQRAGAEGGEVGPAQDAAEGVADGAGDGVEGQSDAAGSDPAGDADSRS
ncbi:hypothetical protein [Ornithinicoccus hortensis]|uniref:Uncharacterized protein n=1 Tax=Ornithinicoccus hortensis TaxID=82346 RepID=A0A542YVN7_9MICO|nr:hypothetical protein [Ornithinicoccus hortensis]TQL52044.1 hypothetical protein FB467_3212 [Ornithinicoccus hortensis]